MSGQGGLSHQGVAVELHQLHKHIREASHVMYRNETITFHMLIWHSFFPAKINSGFFFKYTSIDLTFLTHVCQNLRLQWIVSF